MLLIGALALPVGALSAGSAWCLLKLIGLCTNLFFFGRLETSLISPGSAPHPWFLVLLDPIAGGLIIGLMARFGSEKIRGHGMPEALEAVLVHGSRVQPRVALLKPISAAISIGSGGPFGAEGPIIMTGGALGSLVAQHLRLTADERKALLVAGAAGGMAATFNAPLASVMLAVELLLFEWRPRSMIPVSLAVVVATVTRRRILGPAAVFATHAPPSHVSLLVLVCCAAAGLATGALALVMTGLVYRSEDAFARLPVHWMWWPAIGGAIIGIGGLVEPRALGVGYDVIRTLLHGHASMSLILGILIVKSLIWSVSLGSGTSGGVLAPMFMIGAAAGALLGHVFPSPTGGFWPLMCLAAVLGGVMRAPLTGVIFSMELTGDWTALLPLLISATVAYLLTALILKRSILTEKVARRGFHISREYDVDPLAVLFVREAMEGGELAVFDPEDDLEVALEAVLRDRHDTRAPAQRQRLYPVTTADGMLCGVISRRDLFDLAVRAEADEPGLPATVAEAMVAEPVVAHPDETLREVAYRMAEHGLTRLPVVARGPRPVLAGIVTLPGLLAGRLRDLQEEREPERVLVLPPIRRAGTPPPATPAAPEPEPAARPR